ncbi:MAG: cell surface protein SprA, partial [Ignavibacteriae bacterium 37-53-5]
DFKQDVQINVSGTVGDKLTIGANWDTQNQFDYENQLQIKYKGYDDDIVKSVEAGNVSMSTPSSFIGSNQALFGIKTEMQLGPLTLTALASQQKAQSKTLTVSNGSSSQTFSLHAYDFATNHFFIDTSYIAGYEAYLQQPGNPYNPHAFVTDWEVYISQPNTAANTNIRQGYAVINLPPYAAGQPKPAIYDSLRNGTASAIVGPADWRVESGKFEKLDPSQFTIDQKTGVLTLNSTIQPNQIVAIAFSTSDGTTYGTFASADTSSTSPLVLNMIVPVSPQPYERSAWRLQLRNIYATHGQNLDQNSLKNVQITYTPPGQTSQDNIDNINLLQIFGLDKTGPNGAGGPDGQMDWNPPVDINPTTGEIILPYLEPFKEAFAAYSSGGQKVATPDSFTYDAIYDTT